MKTLKERQQEELRKKAQEKAATFALQRGGTAAAGAIGGEAAANNFGAGLQGLGSLAGAYQGYKQFKDGDPIGGSISAAQGVNNGLQALDKARAANAALEAAKTGQIATEAAGSGIGGYVTPGLAALQGGYGAYKAATNENLSGKEQGQAALRSIGSAVAGANTFGLSNLAEGYANSQWGGTMEKGYNAFDKFNRATLNPIGMASIAADHIFGNKSKAQSARDASRKTLEGVGIIDKGTDRSRISFKDGGTFDIGKDGGYRLKNLAGEQRQNFDVDLKDPNAVRTAGYADALTAALSGGATQNDEMFANKKYGSGITGLRQMSGALTNAAMGQKDSESAMREIYRKAGLDYDLSGKKIAEIERTGGFSSDKGINKAKADSARNALNELFHQSTYAKTKGALSKEEYDFIPNEGGEAVVPQTKTVIKKPQKKKERVQREVLLSELVPEAINAPDYRN
jgi:hypothetical protein